MTTRRAGNLLIVVFSAGFALWAALFISRTSTLAWDGQRYFCLADDAMISMRYADNLAHGRGLVWNAGERVEGYTNPLMTFLMAAPNALLEKRFAVLCVQLLGLVTALGIALLTMRLCEELAGSSPESSREVLRVSGFLLGLAYYPLVYWSLMGMETGLLTLLLLVCLLAALRSSRVPSAESLLALAAAGGLAFLTRADSVVVSGPLVALSVARAWREPRWRRVVPWVLAAYAALPAAQLSFRWIYYGSLVPVTYTLKLGGLPLAARLENGARFLRPFLAQTWPLFVAGAVAAISVERVRRSFALAVPVLLAGYQLSIGGDFSDYWRFLSPGVPVLLVVSFFGSHALVHRVLGRSSWSSRLTRPAALALMVGLVGAANRPFLPEILGRQAPFCAEDCGDNMKIVLALRELTGRTASVGVFMAGTVPYYSERPAIDFLGKSDPYVAGLAPDLSGAVAWKGMRFLPGHNKYDLDYSIVARRPVYIEGCRWGRQDVCGWVGTHYQEVVYKGQVLYLLRDSPLVDWRKARLKRAVPDAQVSGEAFPRGAQETASPAVAGAIAGGSASR